MMVREKDQLDILIKQLSKNDIQKIEEINGKIMGKQIELSMLLSDRLSCLRVIFRRQGIIFKKLKNLKKDPKSVRMSRLKDNLSGKGVVIKNFQGREKDDFYLCSRVKHGKEDDCCGWVKGKPIKERYEYAKGRKKIRGIILRCFICKGVIGERVL